MNSRLNSSEGTVETDIAIVQTLIFLYSHFNNGAVPQGAYNEEITAKLRGENSKRFSVLPPDNAANVLNARGELLDRWGTPYFLHPVSSELIEIRSAGPDRKLWTKDDVQVSSEEGRKDGSW